MPKLVYEVVEVEVEKEVIKYVENPETIEKLNELEAELNTLKGNIELIEKYGDFNFTEALEEAIETKEFEDRKEEFISKGKEYFTENWKAVIPKHGYRWAEMSIIKIENERVIGMDNVTDNEFDVKFTAKILYDEDMIVAYNVTVSYEWDDLEELWLVDIEI